MQLDLVRILGNLRQSRKNRAAEFLGRAQPYFIWAEAEKYSSLVL